LHVDSKFDRATKKWFTKKETAISDTLWLHTKNVSPIYPILEDVVGLLASTDKGRPACFVALSSTELLRNDIQKLGYTICAEDKVTPENTKLTTYRDALTNCSGVGTFKPNITELDSKTWTDFLKRRTESQTL